MLYKTLKNLKSNWYWYLCLLPICTGFLLLILLFTEVIHDEVAQDGLLIETGFRVFALGLYLFTIGVIGIILVVLLKKYTLFARIFGAHTLSKYWSLPYSPKASLDCSKLLLK